MVNGRDKGLFRCGRQNTDGKAFFYYLSSCYMNNNGGIGGLTVIVMHLMAEVPGVFCGTMTACWVPASWRFPCLLAACHSPYRRYAVEVYRFFPQSWESFAVSRSGKTGADFILLQAGKSISPSGSGIIRRDTRFGGFFGVIAVGGGEGWGE